MNGDVNERTLMFFRKIYILLFLCLAADKNILGQQSFIPADRVIHDFELYTGAVFTPVLSHHLFGFNVGFKYYPVKNWGTGLDISSVYIKEQDTFGFSIGKPGVYFNQISWTNQFNLFDNSKIKFGLLLNNGIAGALLVDHAQQEKHWSYSGYTYTSKKIASNHFYLLEPGAVFSVRVFPNKQVYGIYLHTIARYRFVFGNSKFGLLEDYRNYFLSIGFTFMGWIPGKRTVPEQN